MNLDKFMDGVAAVKPTDAREELVTGAINSAASNVKSGAWSRETAVKALSPIVDTVIPANVKGKGHAEKLREFVNASLDDAMGEESEA